jgi:hypothetical protein
MLELIVFLIIFVALATISMTFAIRYGEKHLNAWAKKNNLQIVSCKYHHLMIGPFRRNLFFTGKGGYLIFKFQAKTEQGDIKTGYARVGNYFLSVILDTVEVIWVE